MKVEGFKFNPYFNRKVNTPYKTVKDHILQTVQKTFKNSEDIVTSLWEGKKIDLEKRNASAGIC